MTQEESLADLPTLCDVGAKQDSKGNRWYWTGYKLHIDSAEGGIPISCITTSASLHDSQVAIPLAKETASKVTSFYDLMDSAYDAPQIRLFSKSLNHVPIIDKNIRCKKKKNPSKKKQKPAAVSIGNFQKTCVITSVPQQKESIADSKMSLGEEWFEYEAMPKWLAT